MQEADLLSSMSHPCVIAMYGIIVGQESPATVLEYVRGSSLKSALQALGKQGKVTPRLKTATALQAARGELSDLALLSWVKELMPHHMSEVGAASAGQAGQGHAAPEDCHSPAGCTR